MIWNSRELNNVQTPYCYHICHLYILLFESSIGTCLYRFIYYSWFSCFFFSWTMRHCNCTKTGTTPRIWTLRLQSASSRRNSKDSKQSKSIMSPDFYVVMGRISRGWKCIRERVRHYARTLYTGGTVHIAICVFAIWHKHTADNNGFARRNLHIAEDGVGWWLNMVNW